MASPEIRLKIERIFRSLFADPKLVLRNEMTAMDVPGWDSLMHVVLITSIEKEFQIRFSLAEIEALNNFGELIQLTEKRIQELKTG